MPKEIIPAVVTDDVYLFNYQVQILSEISNWIQVGLMDGEFVMRKTIDIRDLNDLSANAKLEAHLIALDPETYFHKLRDLGFRRVIFHSRATREPREAIALARKLKLEVGLALVPDVEPGELEPYLGSIDMVMVVAAIPETQWSLFDPRSLDKVRVLKGMKPNIPVMIAGGIREYNIRTVAEAGADLLAVGSAVFQNNTPKQNLEKLRSKLAEYTK